MSLGGSFQNNFNKKNEGKHFQKTLTSFEDEMQDESDNLLTPKLLNPLPNFQPVPITSTSKEQLQSDEQYARLLQKQMESDEALARRLQNEWNGNTQPPSTNIVYNNPPPYTPSFGGVPTTQNTTMVTPPTKTPLSTKLFGDANQEKIPPLMNSLMHKRRKKRRNRWRGRRFNRQWNDPRDEIYDKIRFFKSIVNENGSYRGKSFKWLKRIGYIPSFFGRTTDSVSPTYILKNEVLTTPFERKARRKISMISAVLNRRKKALDYTRQGIPFETKFALSRLPRNNILWRDERTHQPVRVIDVLQGCEYCEGKIRSKEKRIDEQMEDQNLNDEDYLESASYKAKKGRSFEVCFVVDCTGSNNFVKILKTKIEYIIAQLLNDVDVRISFILFGDYTDYKMYYLCKKLDFSNDPLTITRFIKDIQQTGGGTNLEEAYELAFIEMRTLNWSANADRYCVVIGDSIPYDINKSPIKQDWRNTVDTKNKRIRISKNTFVNCLAIQCNNYEYATPFYREITQNPIKIVNFEDTSQIFAVFIGILYKNVDKTKIDSLIEGFTELSLTSKEKTKQIYHGLQNS